MPVTSSGGDGQCTDGQYGDQPPQDLAAEQAVLGGMLLSRAAIGDVAERLRFDDFYRPAHQNIYDAILHLHGRGEPADPVTVAAELGKRERGLLRRVGGAIYLHTLTQAVPAPASAGHYARIVAEKALLRKLTEVGTRITAYGNSGADGGDVAEVLERALAEIHDVANHAGGDAPPPPTFRTQLLSILDLANLPAVDPLVADLIFRNTLAQLSGPPGKYKSFISIDLSCALATGQTSWAGHRIRKREKVVYVAAEGASGLRARILAWCEYHGIDPAELVGWMFILPLPIQLGTVVQVDDAVVMAKEVGAGLLVLDTRARCTLGLEENSATEQGEAVHAADRIRIAAGCTVWGIHHTGRSGSTPRGSTAWDGAVWSDLRLESEEEGAAEITVEKHKDAPSGQKFTYRLFPHTVSPELMPDVPEPARKSLVVLSTWLDNSDEIITGFIKRVAKLADNSCGIEGLTRPQLVALAVADGMKQATAYRAVNELIKRSYLHNVGTEKRPRYRYIGRTLDGDGGDQG
jgi:DnaB-like helicase N terminal domain/AAA domain